VNDSQSLGIWRIFRVVLRSCWIAALTVTYVILGSPSDARADRRIAVVSVGACPAREAVVAALAQAMPEATIVSAADVPGDAEPVVVMSDGGISYRVVVRHVVRTLIDAPALCEERARKVAIVAALALEPPEITSDVIHVAAVPPAVAPAAAVPPRRGLGIRLESGGVAERGWALHSPLSPFGGTVRLAVGRDAWALVLGGTLVTWSSIDAYGSVQRIPVDLAFQLRHETSHSAAAIELGPSLVFQRVRDQGESAVRVEADVRFSGRVECWFRPGYGVFAAVTGTYAPNRAPLMDVQRENPMPTLWLSTSAGLVLRIQ
jgi:hypothetical protein